MFFFTFAFVVVLAVGEFSPAASGNLEERSERHQGAGDSADFYCGQLRKPNGACFCLLSGINGGTYWYCFGNFYTF